MLKHSAFARRVRSDPENQDQPHHHHYNSTTVSSHDYHLRRHFNLPYFYSVLFWWSKSLITSYFTERTLHYSGSMELSGRYDCSDVSGEGKKGKRRKKRDSNSYQTMQAEIQASPLITRSTCKASQTDRYGDNTRDIPTKTKQASERERMGKELRTLRGKMITLRSFTAGPPSRVLVRPRRTDLGVVM